MKEGGPPAGFKIHVHQRAVNVLGVDVAPWNVEALIDVIMQSAKLRSAQSSESLSTVHYANVHVLNTAYRTKALHDQLARASTVYCDGSGVRLGALLLGQRLPARLTAADWIDAFCARAAEEGVALFLLGGAEGVAGRAAGVLRERHPRLRIVGVDHGFLNEEASSAAIENANASGADVILVGMGTPSQELWVSRYRTDIEAPVVWTVGALFDFVANVQRRAPRWMGTWHMEWLWRLGTDPRRLVPRYVIGNPLFLVRVVRQRLRGAG